MNYADAIGMLLEYNSKESHLTTLTLYKEYYEPLFKQMVIDGKITDEQHHDIIQILFDVQLQVLETTFKKG